MIDRKTIKKCPLCGSDNIAHMLGDHISKLRGIAYNVPQTVCYECGEVFLGADSLEVILMNKKRRVQLTDKKQYNKPIDPVLERKNQ